MSSYRLNDLKNFIAIFSKNMNYHNIKSHKKSGFHSASTKHIFEKIKLTPEMSIKYLKSVISLSVLS